MKNQFTVFSYSKANKCGFAVPEEYRELLSGYEERHGKIVKQRKRTGGFDFMAAIRIVSLVIFVVALVMLVVNIYEYVRDVQYNEVQNRSVAVSSKAQESLTIRDTPVYPTYEGEEISNTRFDYPEVCDRDNLKQFALTYKDFKFWLYIEDTYVNYPVVQASDNEYYLHRNMDGETNKAGTLFLDYRCNAKTMGGHTIVYGHSMQNGTMFGTLNKYNNNYEYYTQHPVFYTYTDTEVTAWRIFSVYVTNTNDDYTRTRFSSKAEYQSFIDTLIARSDYDTGVEVTSADDIMTFSTCYIYVHTNGRFVVHAVKVGTTPWE